MFRILVLPSGAELISAKLFCYLKKQKKGMSNMVLLLGCFNKKSWSVKDAFPSILIINLKEQATDRPRTYACDATKSQGKVLDDKDSDYQGILIEHRRSRPSSRRLVSSPCLSLC